MGESKERKRAKAKGPTSGGSQGREYGYTGAQARKSDGTAKRKRDAKNLTGSEGTEKAGRGFDKKKKLNPAVVFDMAKRSDYILGMSRRKQARREYFLTKKVNEEKAAKLESRKERRDAVKKAYEEQLHTAGLKVQLTRGPNQEEDVAIPDDESGSGGESSSDDDGGAEVFDDEHTTGRFGSEVVVTTTIGFDAPEESSKEIDDEMAEMMKVRKAELVLRKERAVAKIQKKNLKLRVAAPRKNGLLPAKKGKNKGISPKQMQAKAKAGKGKKSSKGK